MNAKKCDRCGTFYVEVEANVLQNAINEMCQGMERLVHGDNFNLFDLIKRNTDLCTDCIVSLRKWCYKEAEQ